MGDSTVATARPARPAPLTIDAARELIAQWREQYPGKLIVLDVFCGEGGAGKGYADAGHLIIGVDNDAARLARYPFPAVLGDAIETILALGPLVDLQHGSPTCTGYSRGTAAVPDRLDRYDRLIGVTRAAMQETGTPYVIENVADARPEMIDPTMLCWSMFHEPGSVLDTDGTPLTMRRHRLFEASFPIAAPRACRHPRGVQVAGAYGGARRDAWEARHVRKGGYVPASLDVLRALTGLSWATERGTFLSIPPAFTEWVGAQFLAELQSGASTRRDSSPARTPGSVASPGRRTGSLPRKGAPSGSASSARSHQSESAAIAACSPASNRGRDVLA